MQYFFKHIYPVAYPRMHARLDFDGLKSRRTEIRSEFPFEVNPINCPRFIVIGTIRMGNIFRQNEILIRFHLIFWLIVASSEPRLCPRPTNLKKHLSFWKMITAKTGF